MKTRGFTLIELMIVVAVIAIIAAIALPVIAGKHTTNTRSQVVAAQLTYFEDDKTHLCFIRQGDRVVAPVDCDIARKQIREYDRQEQPSN